MKKLIVYRNILKNKQIKLLDNLLTQKNDSGLSETYYELCYLVMKQGSYSILDYIVNLILSDENIFSLKAERGFAINKSIKDAIIHDITILKEIFSADFKRLSSSAKDKYGFLTYDDSNAVIDFFKTESSNKIYEFLYDSYNKNGCGIYLGNCAFTINSNMKIKSVDNFNPISLDMLCGYDDQKQSLVKNTSRFLEDKKGLNVLLFGDRGTGKSTSVKSLIPMFKDKKLKLVEIEKDKLSALPKIASILSNRGYYFIIFIDDLSFDSKDNDYKFLKSVIQGSIYENTSNILFYVTSNRRNLVIDNTTERENEVHISDHLNETASLSDRFGLKLFYHKPSLTEFRQIIRHLAQKNDIDNIEDMMKEAIIFGQFNGGLNGRSAKQFIDTKLT